MKKFFIISLCFLIFATFIGGNVFATTVEGYGELPQPGDYQYYDYLIYKQASNGTIFCVVFYSNNENQISHMSINTSTGNLVVTSATDLVKEIYRYQGNTWGIFDRATNISANQDMGVGSASEVIYNTKNIIDMSTGEVVFPAPPAPPQTVAEMLAVELPEMKQKINGTMKILTVCGVGCLALVIGLPLFGKVFRRFQVK